MKRGVSLNASVSAKGLPEALDAWREQAGRYPDLAPVWCPLFVFPDPVLLGQLRGRGIEPMLYTRSSRFTLSAGARIAHPAYTAQTYLAGDHDAALDAFAQAAQEYGHRLIARFDHEPSLGWAPWSGPPELYIAAWRYISDRLRRAPNIKMYWCGWSGDMEYYPGNRWCDFVGFDAYSKRVVFRELRSQWRKPIAAIRERTKKPIIVGEFGRLRGRPLRWLWMRSLRKVRGVWACVYFDIDVRKSEGKDWRMSPWMRREFMRR